MDQGSDLNCAGRWPPGTPEEKIKATEELIRGSGRPFGEGAHIGPIGESFSAPLDKTSGPISNDRQLKRELDLSMEVIENLKVDRQQMNERYQRLQARYDELNMILETFIEKLTQ